MTLETESLLLLKKGLETLERGFNDLPEFTSTIDVEPMARILDEVATRMQDNYPYAHPLYAGQMLKPPHPMARLAYMLSMWVNPNNHALDGGLASSAMEKEAVAEIAKMFGWEEQHLGHLTSGGTMANLEALWIADKLHPGKMIVGSEQAHYTHSRITEVLKIPYMSVAIDDRARMDLADLELKLKTQDVGTVVVTLGTTGTGSIDPLPGILELQKRYHFRIHIDSAYGGYFTLASNLDEDGAAAYSMTDQADSIVIDPHKCGLQPYGCGCILFKDVSVGAIYKHDSPYTYFSSDDLHLGEISLECSRAGAGAVALWATQKLLPMEKHGTFAKDIEKSRSAALKLYKLLADDPLELTLYAPQLDIVIWAPKAQTASEISQLSQKMFDDAAKQNLHLAVMKVPRKLVEPYWPDVVFDQETVSCLRSCLMKPEHLAWIDEIWKIYKSVR
ncbi:MAG: tyrosine decarboxylase/aspartate 1-decarboxylase [Enterobacterales bacterium]|jgi:tyrosine decarboxylase/aspartate 1-decarboxylase